jgi:tryptophan synthase beta chain
MAPEKPALRPDANGRFGKFGGKYVPETLIAALSELEKEYEAAKNDPEFQVWFVKSGKLGGR